MAIKVLITGAEGFIGRHVLEGMRTNGKYEIHAVSRRDTTNAGSSVIWHHVDLLKLEQARQLIKNVRPQALVHLAWVSTPGVYWDSPLNAQWEAAGEQLIKDFFESGGQRLVVIGTCAEKAIMSAYGQNKQKLREFLNEFCQAKGYSSAWARIYFTFGPHEQPSRLVASVIKSLQEGAPVAITHAESRRDFLYVKDVAQALVKLLESDVCGSVDIGSGQAIAIKDLVEEIQQQIKSKSAITYGHSQDVHWPPIVHADTKRLFQEVGWTPQYSIPQALAETIQWWSAERITCP